MASSRFEKRALVAGILSPILALVLSVVVYQVLTMRSADPKQDWLFRLVVSNLVVPIPFLVTLRLALRDRDEQGMMRRPSKIGLVIAVLSLGLLWKPIHDGVLRTRQERNMALQGVAAPEFDALD